jgi:phosphomannomutase
MVNICPVLMSVPVGSFATRYLHTAVGVIAIAAHNPSKYNGYKVYSVDDTYMICEMFGYCATKGIGLQDYAPCLPKSDVLKCLLEDNCSIVVRPSGTEPKLKTYISVSAENKEAAEKVEAEICKNAEEYLK